MASLDELSTRRAEFVYEAARLEAIASRRPIVPETWTNRDDAFREQFVPVIGRLCADDAPPTTPEAEHDSWWEAYIVMGWHYGPVRDVVAKTHPDMVPYAELPTSEREKDGVFLALCGLARQWIRE